MNKPLIAAMLLLGFAVGAQSSDDQCEMGVAESERGNAEKAIKAFDSCLANATIVGGVRADYLAFRGSLLLLRQARPLEAMRDFEEMIRLRDKPEIYDFFWLAEAQAQLKRFREANATLDAATGVVANMNPSRGKALRDRIEFLRSKFNAAEASSKVQ